MAAERAVGTCRECGAHLSATWRRVWRDTDGDPGLCRRCASRTDRFGTRDAIGPSLDALRASGETPYTQLPRPRERPPTTYAGPACCRLCRRGLDRGRAILWHLLDAHADAVLDGYRGEVSTDV